MVCSASEVEKNISLAVSRVTDRERGDRLENWRWSTAIRRRSVDTGRLMGGLKGARRVRGVRRLARGVPDSE